MTEAILFPDTVKLVLDWLREQLPLHGFPAAVTDEVEADRMGDVVLVRRVGGPARFILDDVTLAVEAWSSLPEKAHDLSQMCRALIHAMAGTMHGGVPIYETAEFAGPALLPDPLSTQPRYTFTIAVTVRGTSITV